MSICPNQPFRYVSTNHAGQWSLVLPVKVLPNSVVTVAMRPMAAPDEAEQQLVDLNVQEQYDTVANWRWMLLAFIASGALITIGNWFIVYRQAPKRKA